MPQAAITARTAGWGAARAQGAACRHRINTPQKCRLNLPQFSAATGRAPGDPRHAITDVSSDGRGDSVVKIGEIVMILDLHRQGLSVSAIARQSGIDRKTVRKYIERGLEAPVYGPRKPRQTVIDPFTAYLRERVTRFPGLTGKIHRPGAIYCQGIAF